MTNCTRRRWFVPPCMMFVSLCACHHRVNPAVTGTRAASTTAPVIIAVSPDTLIMRDGAPAELTLQGRGFVNDSNSVSVGPVTVHGIRSMHDGTRLTFILPDRVASGGGASPVLWTSGVFDVVVNNVRGRSASSHVTIREIR